MAPLIDIFVPCFKPNSHLIARVVQKIIEHTDVPFTLTVMLDGFLAEDAAPIRDLLPEPSVRQKITKGTVLLSSQPVFLKRLVLTALGRLSPGAEFVAIIPSHLLILDEKWFGKVQSPFAADGLAAVSLFGFKDHDASIDPVRFERPTEASGAAGAAIGRRFVDLAAKELSLADWSDFGMTMAHVAWKAGCASWAVRSVRCELLPCVPHVRSSVKAVGASAGTDSRRDRG